MKIKTLLILISLVLYGCSKPEKKLTKTPEERVQSIERIITSNAKLPSKIISADYIAETQGDTSSLGPTDFKFYLRIKVSPEDIASWARGLKKPYNNCTHYSQPKSPQIWWLKKTAFSNTDLYETKSYFNRYNGWILLDRQQSYIYVYTFTM
ncbi:hypothetical protein PQO03_07545 [Lentisphaera profundi]|uniref:Lipoprotein n=1 Tax=Lentisphaera profundi TaxID=1658616 RepID=A0ABY7VPE6_9BACT|nr:hypothetical protein [Lentisphaera profundi]WDE95572.1 hypothetical protein PQO03_07545 [Lentisphaera profundi]